MSTNKQQRASASPKPAVPIRLGRVTITGDQLELDEGFAEVVARAARSRIFAEHVLSSLTMLDDLTRAQQRVGSYLNQCLSAGDVEGVERWASLGMALDHLAVMCGDDIERHWPPTMREDTTTRPLTEDELAAEHAAAAELEAERARMRGEPPSIDQIASSFALERPSIDDVAADMTRRAAETEDDAPELGERAIRRAENDAEVEEGVG